MHLTITHKLDATASPVHSVTIFQSDCAEVVRKFTINLKTGDNIVEISHLPHTMVTESLRVAGIGQAMLKSDALFKLEEEKSLLQGQKRVIDHQANILVRYGQSMTSEHVAPEDMLVFLQKFNEMGEQNAQANIAFEKSLREIETKIEKEVNDPVAEHDNSHLRNIKVKLTINAEEGHAAEISLTYLVKKASWKPVFDLRAVTGADGKPTTKLALHYQASVNQSTGEDWTEAVLNLSTASPDSLGTHIPFLRSMKIVPKAWGGGFFQNKAPQNNAVPNPFSTKNNTGVTLFGSSSAVPGQAPQSANLFGQTAPLSIAPTGGLFGQQQQATNPHTGFGGTPAIPAANAFGTMGSIHAFGATGATLAQGGLFGQAPAGASSAFGGGFGGGGGTTVNDHATTEGFIHVGDTETGTEDPEELPEMEIPSAVTKENSMVANFEVKGNANIHSDGSNHKVAIAVLYFDAKIQTVVVPRSVAGAYLHCTIHNSSKDTHLLPGNMGVYLDEGYITNTSVPHVSPGESFKCSLGRDHSVAVTFDQKSKLLVTPTNLFSANREKVLYTVRITLKNKRDSPIKGMVVRDIVPVSDGEAIKVVLTKPAGLAEAEEGKDVEVEDGVSIRWCESKGDKGGMKEGQLQWTVGLDKRETKILVLEWEVISPPGRQWAYELHSPTKV